MEVTGAVRGSAAHLVTGILTVHFLVTLAGVGDAASVSALELIGCAQRSVTEDFIRIVTTVVLPVAPRAMPHTAAVYAPSITLLAHTVGTVGLFLIGLVLAVGHAITSQSVVNTISISTLKLINVVTCSVEGYAGVVFQKLPVATAAAVDPPLRGQQTQILTPSIVNTAHRELTAIGVVSHSDDTHWLLRYVST